MLTRLGLYKLFGENPERAWPAARGLVIGAACGLTAVGTANLLGDRPDDFLPYGVMICALVGAIGGLFGQYAAWIRAFIATLRQ